MLGFLRACGDSVSCRHSAAVGTSITSLSALIFHCIAFSANTFKLLFVIHYRRVLNRMRTRPGVGVRRLPGREERRHEVGGIEQRFSVVLRGGGVC